MSTQQYSKIELLISVIARMLVDRKHIAVGASSPIPGAAALLAKKQSTQFIRVSVLGNEQFNDFTDGARELFDCAAQGRIDAFFLGGGQIDENANVNLLGLGTYPDFNIRFPGSYGSAYLYFLIPRIILFRPEHSRRTLVKKVDFISAPGTSEKNIYRRGGPYALVTERCVFKFNEKEQSFYLKSIHKGETLESIKDNTGFEFLHSSVVPQTQPPSSESLNLIRTTVSKDISKIYPKFFLKNIKKISPYL